MRGVLSPECWQENAALPVCADGLAEGSVVLPCMLDAWLGSERVVLAPPPPLTTAPHTLPPPPPPSLGVHNLACMARGRLHVCPGPA